MCQDSMQVSETLHFMTEIYITLKIDCHNICDFERNWCQKLDTFMTEMYFRYVEYRLQSQYQ